MLVITTQLWLFDCNFRHQKFRVDKKMRKTAKNWQKFSFLACSGGFSQPNELNSVFSIIFQAYSHVYPSHWAVLWKKFVPSNSRTPLLRYNEVSLQAHVSRVSQLFYTPLCPFSKQISVVLKSFLNILWRASNALVNCVTWKRVLELVILNHI